MQKFLDRALTNLPDVVSSPFALVAYFLVICAWLAIAWRVQRNKNLLIHIKSLPANARLEALRMEMGAVPIKEGLTPEQWLKSRIQSYVFLGFVALCIVILLLTTVAITREPAGTVEIQTGLYPEDENTGDNKL